MLGFWASSGGGVEEWTGLTDTPGTITASRPVVGNSGGTALEFGANALGDYLRRDGTNTITGNILPDGDQTRSFGSVSSKFLDMSAGRLTGTYVDGAGTKTIEFNDALYGAAKTQGGLIAGSIAVIGAGTGEMKLGGGNYPAAGIVGRVFASNSAASIGSIENKGGGAFIVGSAFASGAAADLYTGPTAYGAFCGGYAFANVTPAVVQSTGSGSFVWGYAGNGGIAQSTSTGTMAVGYAAGGTSRLSAESPGAFAQGRCQANAGVYSYLQASGSGSFAQGRCNQNGYIYSTSRGSFAQGNAQNGGAYIRASGNGAFAQGHVVNAQHILSSQQGSFAQGRAVGGNIEATATGAFAVGDAAAGNIVASASNAVQFGPGANAQANSLQVGQVGALGTGLRFHAGGPPAVPVNGDMWVTAAGAVTIFSGGVACVATNAVM